VMLRVTLASAIFSPRHARATMDDTVSFQYREACGEKFAIRCTTPATLRNITRFDTSLAGSACADIDISVAGRSGTSHFYSAYSCLVLGHFAFLAGFFLRTRISVDA
jgi:hypothetical protein